MDWLRILGDALWIIALAMMASSARNAARHVLPGARVPMLFRKSGEPGWRLPRNAAFATTTVLGLAIWLVLLWIGRQTPADLATQIVAFGVRATLAAFMALAHMHWMKAALAALAAEGQLKP